MVRKLRAAPLVCLPLLLAVAAVLPAAEKSSELGRDARWKDMQSLEGVVAVPGRWGFDDLVLADAAYAPDPATELLLHFDGPEAADATGAWTLAGAPAVTSTAASAHGGASAAFTGGRASTGYRPPRGSLLAPGETAGDFTIEFWLYPATLSDGETILSWDGSARDTAGGPLVGQALRVSLRDRRVTWEMRNLFGLPGGGRLPVSITGLRRLLPRAWHHHLLRFDSRTGMLEYLLDGVTEAIVHVTDTGHEGGSVAVPAVGGVGSGPLSLGGGYDGFLDELRISRRFVTDPAVGRFAGRTGTAVSRVIDLGFSSSRVARIEAVADTPADTGIEYFYAVADTWSGRAALGGDADWVPFTPGADLAEAARGRYLQLRVELFPDGRRSTTPRLSSLRVVWEPTTPPAPPAALTAVAGNGSVTLAWRKVSDVAVKGYLVYYGTSPQDYLGTGAAQGDSPVDAGAATSITITGLQNGVLYVFTVAAYDGATPRQQSAFSAEVSARPSRVAR